MGHDLYQINFDTNFGMFCCYFPVWLILYINDPGLYNTRDYIVSSSSILFLTGGFISVGKAFMYGDGGPVEAIENQKRRRIKVGQKPIYGKTPILMPPNLWRPPYLQLCAQFSLLRTDISGGKDTQFLER